MREIAPWPHRDTDPLSPVPAGVHNLPRPLAVWATKTALLLIGRHTTTAGLTAHTALWPRTQRRIPLLWGQGEVQG